MDVTLELPETTVYVKEYGVETDFGTGNNKVRYNVRSVTIVAGDLEELGKKVGEWITDGVLRGTDKKINEAELRIESEQRALDALKRQQNELSA